jgi:hypothetical protein
VRFPITANNHLVKFISACLLIVLADGIRAYPKKYILCYSPTLRQIYRILVKVLRSHSDNYTEKKSRSTGEGGRAMAHIAQIRFSYSQIAEIRHFLLDWPLAALR